MTFDEMSPLQRRLHNAALVIEAEGDDHGFAKLQKDAIDALQPNTQEPVAYVSRIAENGRADISWLQGVSVGDKLFTRPAPQQKPLTDEQRNAIFDAVKYEVEGCWQVDFGDVLDAVEAAHNIGVKP